MWAVASAPWKRAVSALAPPARALVKVVPLRRPTRPSESVNSACAPTSSRVPSLRSAVTVKVWVAGVRPSVSSRTSAGVSSRAVTVGPPGVPVSGVPPGPPSGSRPGGSSPHWHPTAKIRATMDRRLIPPRVYAGAGAGLQRTPGLPHADE
jgi:hypothetical protein